MNKTILMYGALIVVVFGGIFVLRAYTEPTVREIPPGQYDELAQCIADSGAKFYGAFWCPHCQEQKALFGTSERLLPYIECSLPDKRNQTQVCIEAGIESYPTWELTDGTRLGGVLSAEELAEATGCQLPPETS